MKKTKFKRLAVFFTAIVLSFTAAFSAFAAFTGWNGSSSTGGGTSHTAPTNASYSVATDTEDACGYRFYIVDVNNDIYKTNGASGILDVYKTEARQKQSKLFPKRGKVQWVEEYTSKTWQKTSVKTSADDSILSTELGSKVDLKNVKPSGIETWQSDKKNLNPLLLKLTNNEISSTADLPIGARLVVEPIFSLRIEGTDCSMTATEVAIYGALTFKKSSHGAEGNGSSSGSWNYISDYTNRQYANSLYTDSSAGLYGMWDAVPGINTSRSKKTSTSSISDSVGRYTFDAIIRYGYGVGIAFNKAPAIKIRYNTVRNDTTIGASGYSKNSNNTITSGGNNYYDTVAIGGKLTLKTPSSFKAASSGYILGSNYVFHGTNSKYDGKEHKYVWYAKIIADNNIQPNENGNYFLQADMQWTPIKYNVKYYLDGTEQTGLRQSNCEYGKSYTYKSLPTKSGYTVSGWWTGSSSSNKGTEIKAGNNFSNLTTTNGGTVNRYAYSTKNVVQPTYTIAYNANGGSGTMASHTTKSSATIKENTFTRAGYVFNTGWAVKRSDGKWYHGDGTGWTTSTDNVKIYKSGETHDFSSSSWRYANGKSGTLLDGNLTYTFYAQWKHAYTIAYNANGGSGTMTSHTTYGNATIKNNAFTKTNYTFNGWIVKRDDNKYYHSDTGWTTSASGAKVYKSGETYNFNADIWRYNSGSSGSVKTGSITYTFIAQWIANYPVYVYYESRSQCTITNSSNYKVETYTGSGGGKFYLVKKAGTTDTNWYYEKTNLQTSYTVKSASSLGLTKTNYQLAGWKICVSGYNGDTAVANSTKWYTGSDWITSTEANAPIVSSGISNLNLHNIRNKFNYFEGCDKVKIICYAQWIDKSLPVYVYYQTSGASDRISNTANYWIYNNTYIRKKDQENNGSCWQDSFRDYNTYTTKKGSEFGISKPDYDFKGWKIRVVGCKSENGSDVIVSGTDKYYTGSGWGTSANAAVVENLSNITLQNIKSNFNNFKDCTKIKIFCYAQYEKHMYKLYIQYNAGDGLIPEYDNEILGLQEYDKGYRLDDDNMITNKTGTIVKTTATYGSPISSVYGLTDYTTFGLSAGAYGKFVGWGLDSEGNGKVFDQNDLTLKPEDITGSIATKDTTITLYAVWKPVYNVTYSSNGGNISEEKIKAGYRDIHMLLPIMKPASEGADRFLDVLSDVYDEVYTCNHCGYKYYPDKGDSFDEVIYCTNCDVELERETIVLTRHEAVVPTCTQDGHGEYYSDDETGKTYIYDGENYVPSDINGIHYPGDKVIENVVNDDENGAYSFDEVVYCINCGEELSRETITLTKHEACDATDEEDGYDEYFTDEDDTVYVFDGEKFVPGTIVVRHNSGEVVIENVVNDIDDGIYTFDEVIYCTNCDTELSRETVILTKHDAKDPTDDEDGYDEYFTDDNGTVYVFDGEEFIPGVIVIRHNPGEIVIENVINDEENGKYTFDEVIYCTNCDTELSRETITLEKHGKVDATEDHDGHEEYFTDEEGNIYIFDGDEYVPDDITEIHFPGAPVQENAVNDEENGIYTFEKVIYCVNCEIELSRETVTLEKHGKVDPSEDGDGHEEYFTDDNGTTYIYEDGEYVESEITVLHYAATAVEENIVAPSCTEEGSKDIVTYCKHCGEELNRETVSINANGHTVVVDPAVPATCETEGLTEGSHCSVCGKILVAQTKVPAKGHTEKKVNYKEPTCSEYGYQGDIICSVCGKMLRKGVKLDKKDHDWDEGTVVVDSDYSHTGVKEHHCSVCGAHKESIIPQKTGCKMCPKYEANKDKPVIGWIYSVIHFFVHMASNVGSIT